jgi:DNA-binding PadR family transcriptional regulator
VNQELEWRDVRDWAGISRPQVYYSLAKLARDGMIRPHVPKDDDTTTGGPDREVYAITASGRAALKKALERTEWAEQRPPPPFLTWMALSPHASPSTIRAQIDRRRRFLERELALERETLAAFGNDHAYARAMVSLTIRQFEVELEWLAALAL